MYVSIYVCPMTYIYFPYKNKTKMKKISNINCHKKKIMERQDKMTDDMLIMHRFMMYYILNFP